MTPPKVLGMPKPASSVMISSTLGAPFGGTTRGAHHGFDCRAPSLITPPNFGSGGGSCLPSIVAVALGEPRVTLTCCAETADIVAQVTRKVSDSVARFLDIPTSVAMKFHRPPQQQSLH
jgi:hypothetical protein